MGKKMPPKKYKHLKIKLYSDRFEVCEADERIIGTSDGRFTSEKKSEVLVGMAIFIKTYMEIKKDRPLIISIDEGHKN